MPNYILSGAIVCFRVTSVITRQFYQVKSNRESGYGIYDIMLIPNDKNKVGIIIEFKKASKYEKETLEMAA